MADPTRSVVAVVDDDHRTLESLADLLEAAGYEVRLYSSAAGLFAHDGLSDIDCLISDISMPDAVGPAAVAGDPDYRAARASVAVFLDHRARSVL